MLPGRQAAYFAEQVCQRRSLPLTGTSLDRAIVEINKFMEAGLPSRASGPLF